MRALAMVLALAFIPLVTAETTTTDFDVTSFDGTVLKARLYEPDASFEAPVPGILITHGWPGSHKDTAVVHYATRLASQGYLVLTWTARGFGESGGQTHLDGPEEVQDAQVMIDQLAAHKRILLDAPGDPRVGMVGVSYGGGIQLLTAQADKRIDSIVPITTWSNLKESLGPQDVLKRGWVTLLYTAGTAETYGVFTGGENPSPNPDGTMTELNQWYAEAMATNDVSPDLREALNARSVVPGKLATPTFLIQGWPDTLFPVSQALATYHDLASRNIERRLWLTHIGHGGFYDYTGAVQADVNVAVDAWFNHTLRGHEATWTYPIETYRYLEGDRVGEYAWPPPGTVPEFLFMGDGTLQADLPQEDLTTDLVAAVEGGSCAEVPNFQGQASFCPRSDPATSAIWAGPVLEAPRELTGQPVLEFAFESTQLMGTRLFVSVLDIGPSETVPVLRQVTAIRVPGDTTLKVPLEAITHTFEAGHRVGIQISTSDVAFSASREPGVVSILTGPSHLSGVHLPWVETHGDVVPPTLKVFVDPSRPGDNATYRSIRVEARDNWLVANVTVQAGPFEVVRGDEFFTNGAQVNGTGIATQLLRSPVANTAFLVKETATGNYTVTVTVRDAVGLESTQNVTIQSGYEAPVEKPVKKASGVWLGLAVVALAWAARRKW